MAERIVEDSSEIGRLLGLDLPVRADGAPEEREVVVGWIATDERALVTSFIPTVTRRLLQLARAGDFEVRRLYLTDGAITGIEGLLLKQLVSFRKRRAGVGRARPEVVNDEGEGR